MVGHGTLTLGMFVQFELPLPTQFCKYIMFRYFTTVITEEEFNKLYKSPFIKTGNIVLYNDNAYIKF